MFPDSAEGPEKHPFHRPLGNPHILGDFPDGESLVVPEDKDHPLFWGELLQVVFNFIFKGLQLPDGFRVFGQMVRWRVGELGLSPVGFFFLPGLVAAQKIEATVNTDPGEPAGEIHPFIQIKGGQSLIGLDKCFLKDIFGILGVS